MKQNNQITTEVERVPNSDRFMVRAAYTFGGATTTYNNEGKGYTEDEAFNKANEIHGIKQPE